MAFEGMDVDAVHTVYNQMNGLCQQLQSIVTSMPGLVSHLEGAWKGPDAQLLIRSLSGPPIRPSCRTPSTASRRSATTRWRTCSNSSRPRVITPRPSS